MNKRHDEQALFVREQINELVAARKAAGLDTTDMIIRTGWSPGTLRRFETNNSNPTLMQVMVYTDAIGGNWHNVVSVEGALDHA